MLWHVGWQKDCFVFQQSNLFCKIERVYILPFSNRNGCSQQSITDYWINLLPHKSWNMNFNNICEVYHLEIILLYDLYRYYLASFIQDDIVAIIAFLALLLQAFFYYIIYIENFETSSLKIFYHMNLEVLYNSLFMWSI